MYVGGIIGDQGSGKTNLLTAISYKAYSSGTKVIANYRLKFPYTLMSFAELAERALNKNDETVFNAFIAMDELGVGADSYAFFENQPQNIAKLFAQLRKRHCETAYTVQRFLMIARRLRQLSGGFILMEDLDKNVPHKNDYVCNGLFKTTFLNQFYEVLKTKTFNGTRTRDFYDTDEIIWE